MVARFMDRPYFSHTKSKVRGTQMLLWHDGAECRDAVVVRVLQDRMSCELCKVTSRMMLMLCEEAFS